jgi:hypothetical protein
MRARCGKASVWRGSLPELRRAWWDLNRTSQVGVE